MQNENVALCFKEKYNLSRTKSNFFQDLEQKIEYVRSKLGKTKDIFT